MKTFFIICILIIILISSVLSLLVQINYVVDVEKTLIPKNILYINIFVSMICGVLACCMTGIVLDTTIKNTNENTNTDSYYEYEARVQDYYLTENSEGIPYAWYQTDKGLFLTRYVEPTENTKTIVLKIYNNGTPDNFMDDKVMELNFYEYYYEVK